MGNPLNERGSPSKQSRKRSEEQENRVSHVNPIGSGNFEKMNFIYPCD